MPPVKIKNLKCFVEVMRCGSVSDAAVVMDIGQSAVSKNIIELEKLLGLKLFHRNKNHLVPTSEADLLLEKAIAILDQMDDFYQFARDVETLKQGVLSLSSPPSFAEGPLVAILRKFREDHRDIRIMVDSRSSETVTRQVAAGEVDFGFVKLPVDNPDIVVLPLFDSETACVVPVSNPLSDRARLGPTDLGNQSLILLGSGTRFQRELKRAFNREGVRATSVLETHSVAASCAYARQNLGIAIVNGFLAKSYVDKSVRLVPFEPTIRHAYGLIMHRTRQKSMIAAAFQAHVQAFSRQNF